VLLLVGFPGLAGAQQRSAAGPAASEPGAELTVYLMTMGQGDLVWERFGHNAIWIRDPVRGTDRVYNYGLFDFDAPGYWNRFLKGNWIYQMGVDDLDRTLYQYQYFNRSVTVQELNLTAAQKQELQEFLEWNALPENREYRYDYFRDNCSTRVRDALDRVLGGRIRSTTDDVPTGTTYRSHSERLIAGDKVSYTGMIAGLGPAADRPISRWEEMFIPMQLQEHVRSITVPDAAGEPVPLVKQEHTLVATNRAPERAQPPRWLISYLLIGSGLGAAFVLLARAARRSRAARFGFSALSAVWALLIGTGGLILVGLLFTDHTIAHRNENLLQFDPLALPLVLLLPALAYGARWAARPARWLALAVAGISLLGFLLQLLPMLDQVNGNIIALVLPAHAGLAWAAHRLATSGVDRAPPKMPASAPRRLPRQPAPAH
jgi:hypothetical protein